MKFHTVLFFCVSEKKSIHYFIFIVSTVYSRMIPGRSSFLYFILLICFKIVMDSKTYVAFTAVVFDDIAQNDLSLNSLVKYRILWILIGWIVPDGLLASELLCILHIYSMKKMTEYCQHVDSRKINACCMQHDDDDEIMYYVHTLMNHFCISFCVLSHLDKETGCLHESHCQCEFFIAAQ